MMQPVASSDRKRRAGGWRPKRYEIVAIIVALVLLITLVVVVVASGDDETADARSSAVVDETVRPESAELIGADGTPTGARVGAAADQDGNQVDFVVDQVIVTTDDEGLLDDLLERWDGRVIGTVTPAPVLVEAIVSGGGSAPPAIHQLQIDSARVDTSDLEANLDGVLEGNPQPEPPTIEGSIEQIDLRFSDERAMQTFGATVEAELLGAAVAVNPVSSPSAFEDRESPEQPIPCDAAGACSAPPDPNGDAYDPNALSWPYMTDEDLSRHQGDGINTPLDDLLGQDIGVGEAWRLLESIDALDPARGPEVVIFDGGFVQHRDLPPSGTPLGWNSGSRNPASCGGASCYWHGTHVTEAGWALPHNDFGVAGPGGPAVSRTLLVQAPTLAWWDVLKYLLYDVPVALATSPDIINYSGGFEVPAGFCLVGVCSLIELVFGSIDLAGTLVVAAAGNDSMNVDREDCLVRCWEEETVVPCEASGVLCVGGLGWNQRQVAFGSNWGRKANDSSVDMYGPYTLWLLEDPTNGNLSETPRVQTGSGTSYSAPFVAGVASLLWAANPSLDDDAVERILKQTAHHETLRRSDVERGLNRAGWVDAFKAVAAASGGNAPPFVNIESPDDGATFTRGVDSVYMRCTADDLEDGRLPPESIVWTSDRESQPIGTGCSTGSRLLSVGTHRITVTATDSGGAVNTDVVTVTIGQSYPRVDITQPADGAVFDDSQTIHFSATSWDPNLVGPIEDRNVFWSCADLSGDDITGTCAGTGYLGSFGTGHTASLSASQIGVGRHRIILSHTDIGQRPATDQIDIVVEAATGDRRPSVVITTPAGDDMRFMAVDVRPDGSYADVAFVGRATDPEDGDLDGDSILWEVRRGSPTEPVVLTARGDTEVVLSLQLFECFGTPYYVTLVATDSAGHTERFTRMVQVQSLC
jgi:hypothetical protein